MYQSIRHYSIFLFGIAMLATLISCGGGGGGSSDSSTQGTGTVGLFLTDMPADPSLFQSINASIQEVELLGPDGRVTLYSGPVKTVDLLRLRYESIPLTFKDGVPAGVYCKIRLTLSDLELVMVDNSPLDPNDNPTYHPHLPGNGKLDLLARDCFNVSAGEVVTLQLDIDAGRSIHIVGNNNGYNFRPVIFIDVMDDQFESKLIRLEGEITAVDNIARTLLLCDAIPSESPDNLGCVRIHFDDAVSAFFDNVQYSGAPKSIDELLMDNKIGQALTVVGWLKFVTVADTKAKIHLDALVAELGTFLQVEGTVAVNADVDGFAMQVSPGGPIITSQNLAVMFQLGSTGINGTRFVSKDGDILLASDVNQPLPVQVDGTLQLNPDVLMAALVIVDQGALNAEQVTGLVLTVGSDIIYVNPDMNSVCGVPTDYLEVDLLEGLKILTVTYTGSVGVITPGGNLVAGQTVGMNGSCEVTGYQTDNIVIVVE